MQTMALLKARFASAYSGWLTVLCLAVMFVFMVFISFFLGSTWLTVQASPAPVGTRVENQAYAEYAGANNAPIKIASNVTSVTVGQVSGLTLTASQERLTVPGAVVYFSHTVTNVGNGPEPFLLAFANDPGAYDYTNIALYADLNSDGVPDSNTPITQTPVLQAGQSFQFLVRVQIPASASNGQRDQLTIVAASDPAYAAANGIAASSAQSNRDGATITLGPVLQLSKSLDVMQGASPSGLITVSLRYSNIGFQVAKNVIISDLVPGAGVDYNTQGLRYVDNSGIWNTLALTDAPAGDPSGIDYQYQRAGVFANSVRAVIASLAPGATGVLQFQVQALAGLQAGAQLTSNRASVSFDDQGVIRDASSNLAPYTVVAATAPGPDLVLTKSGPAAAIPGACMAFQLQVRNLGTVASSGPVVVSDTLPAGLDYQATCTIAGQTLSSGGVGWACVPALAAGAAPAQTIVQCTSLQNYVPASTLNQGAVDGHTLTILARVNAATLNPALPAINAQPNTVAAVNRASVQNASEPDSARFNNSAQATVRVGPAATVRGAVWLDANHDRVFQSGGSSGDVALAGWQVEVLQGGVVLATASTGADGRYVITDLLPGTYEVQFRDPNNSIINGRPVCNEQGLASNTSSNTTNTTATTNANASNCARTDLSNTPSQVGPRNDRLLIDVQAGDTITQASLPLDPSGVVYDSLSRLPIAGAVVTLVPPPGFDAALYLIGGSGNLSQRTGASGYYQYLLTPAGVAFCGARPAGCIFGLTVVPPATHLPPDSTILPPAASLNCAGTLHCLSPTGLGTGGVYTVQAQATAPAVGQPTPYYTAIRLTAGDPDVVNNHIPLDPIAVGGQTLLLQKKASRPSAEAGDFVDYTLTLKNPGLTRINQVSIQDRLPLGFQYVRGSSRASTASTPALAAIADPTALDVNTLAWGFGSLDAGASVVLTYRLRLSIDANRGTGINEASAVCASLVPAGAATVIVACSNRAQAKVQVTDGVLSGKPVVIGKVYLDCNRDRLQSDREIGIPGVRVFAQDGSYAVTDAEGKYSLYGLAARTHVLKLDPLTLPIDYEPVMLNNRQAGDAMSRFVDLSLGELHKANFADGACYETTVAEVHRRRETALADALESVPGAPYWDKALDYTPQAAPSLNDARTRSATGFITGNNGSSNTNPAGDRQGLGSLASNPTYATPSPEALSAADKTVAAEQAIDLEKRLEDTSNQLSILNLKDGQILTKQQTNVQIRGTLGGVITLVVNDTPIAEQRIGKRSQNETQRAQGLEYIAVPLKAGVNQITLTQKDPMGNERGRVSIQVRAPGDIAQIDFVPVGALLADSRLRSQVKLLLKDALGTPVTERSQVTVKLLANNNSLNPTSSANTQTSARIANPDQNPNEDGVQLFTKDGAVIIDLIGPDSPSQVLLSVQAGVVTQSSKLDFVPALRPLVGAGIVEGAIALRGLKNSQVSNTGRGSFEQELSCLGRPTLSIANTAGQWDCLSRDFAQGRVNASATSALYFKGAVKGEYLLTLAYDSAKDTRARVFRDIQPDETYPVYGDASQRGFDANSTEKLYVRVDKGNSFVLYGDFNTASAQAPRQLSQYSRSLTGILLKSGDELDQIQVFASKDSLKQKVVDIPANGTSGPFTLNATGVINSERVEVITRDRAAPSIVLNRISLVRFADYEIEAYTGNLLLKAPIPSVDVNLNPISLRVTYEQDLATEAFWTAGVQGHNTLGKGLQVGGVAVKSFKPDDAQTLLGAYAQYKLAEGVQLVAELAKTSQENLGAPKSGQAGRLELTAKTSALDLRLQAQKTSLGFDNPSSPIGQAQLEILGKLSYKLDTKLVLGAEVLHTPDTAQAALGNTTQRSGGLLKAEYQWSDGLKLEAGLRHVKSDTTLAGLSTPDQYTSARLKASYLVSPQVTVFGELEQALTDSQRRLLAVGADYRLANKGRIYARHELANTLGSDYALSPDAKSYRTVLGVDAPVFEGLQSNPTDTSPAAPLFGQTQAFSEYRLKDSLAGQDAQAAMGLKNAWTVRPGLQLNSSIERTQILKRSAGGFDTGAATAASIAALYTGAPDWKSTGRLEWRKSATQTSWLNTLGAAYKLDQDWHMLGRSTVSHIAQTGSAAGLATGLLSTGGVQEKYRLQLGVAYRDLDHDVWNGLAKIEQVGERDTTAGLDLKRTTRIASVHLHRQINRGWWVSSSLAIKQALDQSGGLRTRSTGVLATARLNWDITHRWDAGLRLYAGRSSDSGVAGSVSGSVGGSMGGSGSSNTRLGAGLELGYMLHENTWLSVGYNLWGVRDRDLSAQDYTERGAYLRLRYKFDETLFVSPSDKATPTMLQSAADAAYIPSKPAAMSIRELLAVPASPATAIPATATPTVATPTVATPTLSTP